MLRIVVFALTTLAGSAVLAQNVAVVNNRPIPKAREDAWVKQLQQQGQQDTPELRKMIREELIRREVFLQEVQKRALAEQPDVKFQLDIQRQNTLIQALMRDELKRNPITDAQVQAEYDKQKGKAGEREFRARHILVEKEDEAKALIAQIKGGAKFEDLAKKNSKDPGSGENGGDLDFAAPGAYVPEFSQAMVKLGKGEMTETPVKSQFGWHIIKLEDTREAKFPPIEEVKGQIQQRLGQQKLGEFRDAIRAKAKTDYKFSTLN
jgi:peptidyl-prolyl cis-trans isomerase C